MSAFTEPLAQARANTQHILEGPGVFIPKAELHHAENCPGCKVDAALAQVERLATDMERDLEDAHRQVDHARYKLNLVLSAREEGADTR